MSGKSGTTAKKKDPIRQLIDHGAEIAGSATYMVGRRTWRPQNKTN